MMKKNNLLLTTLFCFVLIVTGQTDNTSSTGNSSRNSIPEQIKERKAFKRAEWFFNQRAYPYDTIPAVRYQKEMTKEIQKARSNVLKDNDDLTWTSVGPAGVIFDPEEWGIVSGRTKAIAVHPINPQIVYIGAACGGIWKTTDGGQTWLDVGHDLESVAFGAIAIDPSNPETIYAGSGECLLLDDFYTFSGRGLFKSTDGGSSWTVITDGFGWQTHFSDLAVHPNNSNVVFATIGGGTVFSGATLPNEGIWKSLDGGITWNKTLDVPDVSDIAFHPNNPNILYAAAGGYLSQMMGFFTSTDQGESWAQSNSGLNLPALGGRMQFDISLSDPSIIYAVIFEMSWTVSGPTCAYKSVNGGNSWTQISVGTQLGGNYGGGWVDQGWYDLCIAVDPDNPDHVLIGNVELHRTTDGSSYAPVRPYGSGAWGSLCHVDYHKLVFAPSNHNILYIGCDGGFYKSTDKGYTATSQNLGLETMQFYRIASHPTNPQVIIGGMQDNSTAMTTDGGQTWEVITGGDGMECLFNPNPDTIYTASQNGYFYRSINGGASFNSIYNANGAWITPLLMHPTNHKILYTANKRIWKSVNGGNSFQLISGTANLVNSFINTMAQSHVNPSNMIFGAGIGHPYFDTVYVVQVSVDEGVSWYDVSGYIPGESRWIARVATDPVDANTMYILRTGFSPGNKVWKTTNLGITWTNISGNLPDLPCSDLFIDPENTQHLYVANDIGVYHSGNGGISWEYASEGIPFVPAIDFDYVKIGTNRYLRVGTHGRSIYETILPNYCLPEGISFQSQSDVDNFQTNYPGCTEIEGDVIINGYVFNLDGLSVLKSIGGNLSIDCVPLIDLTGLDSLTYIGGHLGFWATELVDMTGLGSLEFIGGSLIYGCFTNSAIVCNNPLLVNLTGLESLTYIGGELYIADCQSLTDIDALSGVTSLGGINILGNSNLISIVGLENINADSLSQLTIAGNSSLSSCNITGICNFLNNPVGQVNIFGNAEGCNNPPEIASACGISLPCLPFGNYIFINQTEIDNFQYDYPGCTGLEGKLLIGIDEEWFLPITCNISNLNGLLGIKSIGDNLWITTCDDGLYSLTGLDSLNSVGGDLYIAGNYMLSNLWSLNSLTSIGGDLTIYSNNSLTSLTGLDNIEANSIESLEIRWNSALSNCDVLSTCDYLAIPGAIVDIENNAPGCNSPEEVEAACLTTVEEIRTGNGITIIPNPSNDKITISSNSITGKTKLSIFNVNGEKVIERQLTESQSQINISALQMGVYFVRLQYEKMVEVGKILKQ